MPESTFKRHSLVTSVVPLIIISLITTSCAKFQYVTLSGDLSNSGRFVYEDDTLKVTYGFNGPSGPLKIEVFNKVDKGIYIDWKKSALIVNNERTPYWTDATTFSGSSNSTTINWANGVGYTETFSSGSLVKGEQISFIPPRSFVQIAPLTLTNTFLNSEAGQKRKVRLAAGGNQGTVTSFTRENTPMIFRSYLTLSANEQFDQPKTLNHEFWVSETIETLSDPSVVPQKADAQFYVEGPTEFGTVVLTTFAIVSLLALLIISAGN